MKFSWALASILLAASLADAADKPDPNHNLIGLETPEGKIAFEFIDLWFNQHQPRAAFEKFVAHKGYVNHAVYSASTGTLNRSFEEEIAQEMEATGNTHFDVKQLVAQGGLVFAHIAATQTWPAGAPPAGAPPVGAPPVAGAPPMMASNPEIKGDHKGPDEMIVILRVHNGKVVDHWDMHVPTNSDSVVFWGLDRPLP